MYNPLFFFCAEFESKNVTRNDAGHRIVCWCGNNGLDDDE